ncbi:collagen alpha-1(I) chain-like [Marmota monax]|uniref:collagen alpha-1(I) chain-like n=1 Tax=Marmota monax TaxID=9995 RepID=UPI001EB0A864|nr:collagen alpha-1(I) chain-like [Marmota monax]
MPMARSPPCTPPVGRGHLAALVGIPGEQGSGAAEETRVGGPGPRKPQRRPYLGLAGARLGTDNRPPGPPGLCRRCQGPRSPGEGRAGSAGTGGREGLDPRLPGARAVVSPPPAEATATAAPPARSSPGPSGRGGPRGRSAWPGAPHPRGPECPPLCGGRGPKVPEMGEGVNGGGVGGLKRKRGLPVSATAPGYAPSSDLGEYSSRGPRSGRKTSRSRSARPKGSGEEPARKTPKGGSWRFQPGRGASKPEPEPPLLGPRRRTRSRQPRTHGRRGRSLLRAHRVPGFALPDEQGHPTVVGKLPRPARIRPAGSPQASRFSRCRSRPARLRLKQRVAALCGQERVATKVTRGRGRKELEPPPSPSAFAGRLEKGSPAPPAAPRRPSRLRVPAAPPRPLGRWARRSLTAPGSGRSLQPRSPDAADSRGSLQAPPPQDREGAGRGGAGRGGAAASGNNAADRAAPRAGREGQHALSCSAASPAPLHPLGAADAATALAFTCPGLSGLGSRARKLFPAREDGCGLWREVGERETEMARLGVEPGVLVERAREAPRWLRSGQAASTKEPLPQPPGHPPLRTRARTHRTHFSKHAHPPAHSRIPARRRACFSLEHWAALGGLSQPGGRTLAGPSFPSGPPLLGACQP